MATRNAFDNGGGASLPPQDYSGDQLNQAILTVQRGPSTPGYWQAVAIVRQAALAGNSRAKQSMEANGNFKFQDTATAKRVASAPTSSIDPGSPDVMGTGSTGGSAPNLVGNPMSISPGYNGSSGALNRVGQDLGATKGGRILLDSVKDGVQGSQNSDQGQNLDGSYSTSQQSPGSRIPLSSQDLGGSYNKGVPFLSAYLQSVKPGDPALTNSLLMSNGYANNSYMNSLVGPVADQFVGLNRLANPGVNTSKQGQLQNLDSMVTGLAGGTGGQGMIDAQALYDNLFSSGGMGDNGYLNHDPTPNGQFKEVMNLLNSLAPVVPQETLQSLQSNIGYYYMEYSDLAARGGIEPATTSFIDYLISKGAPSWF